MTQHTRLTLQPGYILHRKPYRDTSLLLEVFTLEHGRLGLVSKGARSGRGRLAAQLQPFRPLLLSWSGRGELQSLTAAEPNGAVPSLAGTALISGFYVNELLMRLLHRHDPHPELYDAYHAVLPLLAAEGADWALRLFEKRLLEELGYGLNLDREGDSDTPIQPEARYCYHLERGALPQVLSADGIALSGRTLLALGGEISPDDETRREAKRLMRAALGLYLGSRPLQSRELFRQTFGQRGDGGSDNETKR